MKRTKTLAEFMEFAHSAEGKKKLLTSQQESTSPDLLIGDEDIGAASVSVTLLALLESGKESMFFSAAYEDEKKYNEAIRELQKLEETIPSEKVEPSEIDKRTGETS